MLLVECLCAGKSQHDPSQCRPTGQPGQGSGPPPHHCPFLSHGGQLSSGVYWKVLWAVVLTCLRLCPGTLGSTLISGQCTLVCCCFSALHCQNTREETLYSRAGERKRSRGRKRSCGLTRHTQLKVLTEGPSCCSWKPQFWKTQRLECVGTTTEELGMC